MFVQGHISIGFDNRLSRFLAKESAKLSLAVLLLGGILHATPIMNYEDWQLQDSRQLASHSVQSVRIKSASGLMGVDADLAPHPNGGASLSCWPRPQGNPMWPLRSSSR
jgi:hypothetical protein